MISSVTVLAASVISEMLVLAGRVTVLGESVTVLGGSVIVLGRSVTVLITVQSGSVIYTVDFGTESDRRKLPDEVEV